ncbi:hypothetical protein [uncultured Sphaerochaeta sp.]|uniref:hypothetical protein n=2 Tax=Sphaerochaeta TaxID=399320 RepID=UPI0029C9BF07|nr:hypothetical protein [uncultured Sphaerochaeta sp.]
MQSEITTIGAPVMLIGLLVGFFLCFYGYKTKSLLVRLRSVVSGSIVFLFIALMSYGRESFMQVLQDPTPLRSLWNVLFNPSDYRGVLLYLVSFASGGLVLFLLARKKQKIVELVVALFTAVSMSLIIFFLLLSFLPLTPSFIVTAVALVVILSLSITRFESYMALESAIAGSLIVAWLLSRFWYLQFWLFFALWAILAFLGILNQMHMLSRKKEAEHA